ncbi:MAG: DUF3006 domain-containing protein [Candidatus Berkelbacteria bacterium]|nr:DUF3006 domain-containing protein [Candidatus Berkelbacteria bacterium]
MFKAIVDRFEGEYAVLIFDDGKKIDWPKDKLPKNIKEGSVVWFSLTKDKEGEKKQRELAKEILNEILAK